MEGHCTNMSGSAGLGAIAAVVAGGIIVFVRSGSKQR